ncbi:MAG: hypothetical protein US40_C0015G0015 [Candidatus Roizmanbacteria bacterium GW2011_GWC2_37_13]|uniref:HYDIN/VesB/CFA65-like Ig-like domain-containing protein n=1 Tax=Candidatus Roizmanbacteria bacterium GW2011_GWC2_37_13 TaxID=1618486 RepID=A0A0G0IK66_9BACT|nr:MAG: hypothetical protein US38_C0015G0014 [Candidatus Roizmanbacteria bacterium GW2011_GWC1_37_12]KKQ24584.1 MAG: hypothetical protein US40_C0015G0015 [Candidatus Roizmanbacteria bacterium GW2011_GWC2_37_13]
MKAIWVILGIVLTAGLIVGSYFLLNPGGEAKVTVTIISYKITDKERPKVEVKGTSKDLGKMKVSDEKSAEFIIKNIGQKPLQMSRVNSSCNCTFGQVVIDGKESELYGMHNVSNFAGEVLPGKTAMIKVIYRPFIMPVYGIIDREVYVETNDPENQKLIFKVKANVN